VNDERETHTSVPGPTDPTTMVDAIARALPRVRALVEGWTGSPYYGSLRIEVDTGVDDPRVVVRVGEANRHARRFLEAGAELSRGWYGVGPQNHLRLDLGDGVSVETIVRLDEAIDLGIPVNYAPAASLDGVVGKVPA